MSISSSGQTGDGLYTQHKFHRLNEENGLTNNVVNDITRDTLGYIWVATEGGIARYQGNKFQIFKKERDNQHSLPHNLVYRLFIDADNLVWVLAEDGVARYDYVSDAIMRFKPDILTGSYTSMAVSGDGTYFFARYEGGVWSGKEEMQLLNLIDQNTGRDLSQFEIVDISLVDNHLWIGFRYDGFCRYDLIEVWLYNHQLQLQSH